jgi:hypothetical protein
MRTVTRSVPSNRSGSVARCRADRPGVHGLSAPPSAPDSTRPYRATWTYLALAQAHHGERVTESG